MPEDEISNEELERILASVHDNNGKDQSLAAATAGMTPAERRAARKNIDRWVARARKSLHERNRDL